MSDNICKFPEWLEDHDTCNGCIFENACIYEVEQIVDELERKDEILLKMHILGVI